jgi:hypothetical protein
LFGPTALKVAVKGILRHIQTNYGPLSNTSREELAGELQILPFEVDHTESQLSFEDKRAAMVKRIVFAFVEECLDMPVELAAYRIEIGQ